MNVSLHQMGWQLCSHLLADRNVKDLSPEKSPHIGTVNKSQIKFIPDGMVVQLPPTNR